MLIKKLKPIKPSKGFTLIELLVVIGIIGVLATIAATAVQYARNQAKVAKALSDSNELYKALTAMSNDTGAWSGNQYIDTIGTPGSEICGDGCAYGLAAPEAGIAVTDGSYANWSGPYMEDVPTDPWGNQYFFDSSYQITTDNLPCNGGGSCIDAAVIGSYGPDGVGNNQFNGDDVIKVIFK